MDIPYHVRAEEENPEVKILWPSYCPFTLIIVSTLAYKRLWHKREGRRKEIRGRSGNYVGLPNFPFFQ